VPRRRVEHSTLSLEEMDVDAVVRRAPELALVDELAHTNAPGSRNAKRYEDIEEILEAGIDVVSTVNVQHLESLNDAVFELTGVRVRETFPDRLIDEADEVVLVDLAPEELRQRLRDGKVYAAGRVETALQNFFRPEKLAALRELALREVVEDVEARRATEVLDPLARAAILERILVLVTAEPSAQRLLRRAWRSGQRLGAEVDALYVHEPGRKPVGQEAVALAALRRLAILLGVHFLEEESDDLVEAVRKVAADRGTTYVFLGPPEESRLDEILRGSLVNRLVRALPGIDLRIGSDRARREELSS
jgi:two-component system, OmpR family, sensor histidine kinase KdpD